jgi:uncharacterized protein (DUF488 family)
MGTLATIGYEGSSLDDFVATLKVAGVEVLLDIRQVPISRRVGFAKTALSAAVEAAGITYVHLRGLGDPKEGRVAARSGNYARFRDIFERHLETDEAKDDLRRAVAVAERSATCLLCYERNPKECHRLMVADLISDTLAIAIRHLGVKSGIASHAGDQPSRTSSDTRQGFATCR